MILLLFETPLFFSTGLFAFVSIFKASRHYLRLFSGRLCDF